jgi:hypothetical protein
MCLESPERFFFESRQGRIHQQRILCDEGHNPKIFSTRLKDPSDALSDLQTMRWSRPGTLKNKFDAMNSFRKLRILINNLEDAIRNGFNKLHVASSTLRFEGFKTL